MYLHAFAGLCMCCVGTFKDESIEMTGCQSGGNKVSKNKEVNSVLSVTVSLSPSRMTLALLISYHSCEDFMDDMR